MTDEQRLAEIRSRAEAATPGPWRAGLESPLASPDAAYRIFAAARGAVLSVARLYHAALPNEANAAFVAHAREDVPYLLALVADLQRVLGDLCAESDAAAEALRCRRVLEEITINRVLAPLVGHIAREALAGEGRPAGVDDPQAEKEKT